MTTTQVVAVSRTAGGYPEYPFSPQAPYPEYRGNDAGRAENHVWEAVRRNFRLLGYDHQRFGTPTWNPLGFLIQPAEKVFVKPNLVDHRHRFGDDVWSVITHPSIIRCVVDYVLIALGNKGVVIVGDNPHVDADFDVIRRICRFDDLSDYYWKMFAVEVRFVDCRLWHVRDLSYYSFKKARIRLEGDPGGTVSVNIGSHSLFTGISNRLFRGTYTDRRETRRFHEHGAHIYTFSRSMYEADAFISIPKLKTHTKVGATLNVKGLIGTIAEKNGLVHWRIGFPRFCGDEYPRPRYAVDYLKLAIQHFLADIIPEPLFLFFRDKLHRSSAGRALQSFFQTEYQKSRMLRGAFPCNDTTWRTAVDVYNAFLGECGLHARRKVVRLLSVIDGVIGGDTDGPHFPNPVMSSVIITGNDLVATDLVASRLMDFDISHIAYLVHLAGMKKREIKVVSEDLDTSDFFNPSTKHLLFRPPHGWERMSLHGVKPGKVYETDSKIAKDMNGNAGVTSDDGILR